MRPDFDAANHDFYPGIVNTAETNTNQDNMFTGILGLHRNKFAELYGLGSDMEPILMVCSPLLTVIS